MEDKTNRAFNEMYIVAKKRLENKSPLEIAQKAGVEFCQETSTFKIKSLNKTTHLMYPSYKSNKKLEEWYILILLHYLDLADGTPLFNQPLRFGQLKDGLIRGVRFDKTVENELSKFLLHKNPQEIINMCHALGGEITPSKFDLTAVFHLFPHYTITLNIWFEDEEFPPIGHMLVDKSADHYLTIEDSVMAGELMLRCFSNTYKSLQQNNS